MTYLPNGASTFANDVIPSAQHDNPTPPTHLSRPILLLYTRFVESPPERTAAMLRAIKDPFTLLVVGAGLQGEQLDFPAVHAGWVEADDLPAYFALADLAMFPMEDTLLNRAKCSVKLVDLLSAGVPVVAEDVGQCREYVVDGESGVLVPPGDLRAFGSAVGSLLRDPGKRRRLSAAARDRITASFGWPGLVDRLEEGYQAAVQRRTA